MALESPVTKVIHEAVAKNILILGICNGFQILTKLNLLPGSYAKIIVKNLNVERLSVHSISLQVKNMSKSCI